MGYKSLPEDNSDRYRLLIYDGKYSYAYGMLAVSLNYLIVDDRLENFTIIRAKKFAVNNVATKATAGKDKRKLIIFLDIEPLVPGSEVRLLCLISRSKSKLLFL